MSLRHAVTAAALAMIVAACWSTTSPSSAGTGKRSAETEPVVATTIPRGGAVGVDPATPVTVVFSAPMMIGMAALVMLHEGSVTGPQVGGTAVWSADRTTLTFTPAARLKSETTYVLHFSPNLKAANGEAINWAGCFGDVGGQPIPNGTFGGGMMGGSGMGPWMMGPGWQPGSGTWGYGMVVSFTTT